MRVFRVRQVAKFMRTERVPDSALCQVSREVVAGTLGAGEADLGNGLFKKRIARPGGGKRGGYRVIVAYHPRRTERVLVAFAFAKNAASTLTGNGQGLLAKAAALVLAASERELTMLLVAGTVEEVMCDAVEQG